METDVEHLQQWRGQMQADVQNQNPEFDATVKTSSSRSGPDEGGKCNSVGLSAVCLNKVATIRSVVVAVA